MNWNCLQIGKVKAVKRCPWANDKWYKDHPDDRIRQVGMHRKTTKRCSVAIHGCGNRRDLEGPSYQEKRMLERYSLQGE